MSGASRCRTTGEHADGERDERDQYESSDDGNSQESSPKTESYGTGTRRCSNPCALPGDRGRDRPCGENDHNGRKRALERRSPYDRRQRLLRSGLRSDLFWYFKVAIDAVWGMYIHSNIDVRSGWMHRVFSGPEMHRWHHAVEIIVVNFATKFAFRDWLCGTAYLPDRKPVGYGLVADDYPTGYLPQPMHAFRRSPPLPDSPSVAPV